ncbi:hypothetical protein OsJ_15899 [Oryza sativa Japonica Group]|uniref:Uncharacterized protein n=1 Tax=Oryza sativa subsp. japonica TaxID=39947 RepID=B9FC49_ORYSJ|nr:hypothetical protein OsJ_15899 [Oryza sativa Japonica Group]
MTSPYGPWGRGAGAFFMPHVLLATLYEHHRFRQGFDFRNINPAVPARQLVFFGSPGTGIHQHPPLPPPPSPPPPPHQLHITVHHPSPVVTAGLPMVVDSVPHVNNPAAASKRVRLFGVNLDNPHPGRRPVVERPRRQCIVATDARVAKACTIEVAGIASTHAGWCSWSGVLCRVVAVVIVVIQERGALLVGSRSVKEGSGHLDRSGAYQRKVQKIHLPSAAFFYFSTFCNSPS